MRRLVELKVCECSYESMKNKGELFMLEVIICIAEAVIEELKKQ